MDVIEIIIFLIWHVCTCVYLCMHVCVWLCEGTWMWWVWQSNQCIWLLWSERANRRGVFYGIGIHSALLYYFRYYLFYLLYYDYYDHRRDHHHHHNHHHHHHHHHNHYDIFLTWIVTQCIIDYIFTSHHITSHYITSHHTIGNFVCFVARNDESVNNEVTYISISMINFLEMMVVGGTFNSSYFHMTCVYTLANMYLSVPYIYIYIYIYSGQGIYLLHHVKSNQQARWLSY